MPGLETADVEASPARLALSALRKGRYLATVFDLEPNDRGLQAMWLGLPSWIARGPFWLAQRVAVPIVPTFCLRRGMEKFHLIFEEPIFPQEADFVQKVVARMGFYQRRYWTRWAFFRPLGRLVPVSSPKTAVLVGPL